MAKDNDITARDPGLPVVKTSREIIEKLGSPMFRGTVDFNGTGNSGGLTGRYAKFSDPTGQIVCFIKLDEKS